MLKKRNIAMTMAVATAATTVAPAFAATLDGETVSLADAQKMAELREEVKGLIEAKYTTKKENLLEKELVGQNVYTVEVAVNGDEAVPVNSMRDLEKEIAKLKKENDYLTITAAQVAGKNEVDGEIVDWEIQQYTKNDINEGMAEEAGELVTGVSVSGKTAQITMQNNKESMYLTVGDDKLNFEDPIYKKDSNGNHLDVDGNIIVDIEADADKLVVLGFEKEKSAVEMEDALTFTVKYSDVKEVELKSSDLYNAITQRLTKDGNELAKYIRDYNLKIEELAAEVNTTITEADKIDADKIEVEGTTLTISVPKNSGISRAAGDYVVITIKGANTDLLALEAKLEDAASDPAQIETLAGASRIETAIEVSKDTFADGTAKNVVLVSDQAIADGLAATPFAAQKEAPVLLTNKDSISEEVMDEIERVMEEGGKVYLVGGENVLTENIESQLDAKFLDFERIAGKDRESTSLEIAKKMDAVNELYIAGSYAQADSMSIAAYAAQEQNPILLVGANGLTEEQTKWVKFNAKGVEHYIIGGESHISKETQAKLDDLTTEEVTRLAGDGRQETNAKVIETFYDETINTVYVAKSDDKGLVDALSAGVAAGLNDAPVILATDSIHSTQKKVLKDLVDDGADIQTQKQVGYGIADKVWETLTNLFN